MMTLKTRSAYWWKGRPNFGDALTPLLLERFSRVRAVWSEPQDAEILSVGSILESLKLYPDWDGVVLGSGKLYDTYKPTLQRASVMALRGPLTAEIPGVVLGDPGILSDELVTVSKRTFDLGIVPHWSDNDLEKRREFRGVWKTVVIDPEGDPLDVIQQIGSCKKIVSSSLHGVIVADAFGIPRRTEVAPRLLNNEGGTFKFLDWAASIGVPFSIGETQAASRHRVESMQHQLFDTFEELGRQI